jgi:hypothetical protein
MPMVYLSAQPSVSRDGTLPRLEPLAEWGRLRVLINPGEDPRYNPTKALNLIRKRLADFNPKTDFLVWVGGDTLAAMLVGIVLSDMSVNEQAGFAAFKWLRWDRGRTGRGERTDAGGRYVPITVELPDPNTPILPPLSHDDSDPD